MDAASDIYCKVVYSNGAAFYSSQAFNRYQGHAVRLATVVSELTVVKHLCSCLLRERLFRQIVEDTRDIGRLS